MTDATPSILNAFKFHIEWAGVSLAFSEVWGLGEPHSLTLSRGLFRGNIGFKVWLEIVSMRAQDLTLHMQDNQSQIVASWVVKNAILLHHMTALHRDEKAMAIESIQVQHTGLTLVRR